MYKTITFTCRLFLRGLPVVYIFEKPIHKKEKEHPFRPTNKIFSFMLRFKRNKRSTNVFLLDIYYKRKELFLFFLNLFFMLIVYCKILKCILILTTVEVPDNISRRQGLNTDMLEQRIILKNHAFLLQQGFDRQSNQYQLKVFASSELLSIEYDIQNTT